MAQRFSAAIVIVVRWALAPWGSVAANNPIRSSLTLVSNENRFAQDSALDKARRERRRALIVPREHGAWGLLLVPLITGAGVAFHQIFNPLPIALLLIAALSLFWARTPVESLLGTSAMRAQSADEKRSVLTVIIGLSTVAVLSLGILLWRGRNFDLWFIGMAAAVAFVGQASLKKLGRRARMPSEMVGTIGLASAGPAAYYVITGKFDALAWMLWLANFIFAGNQIHYVQLRIRAPKVTSVHEKFVHGWTFALGQILMMFALIAAAWLGHIPWFAVIAFAPLLLRGWFYFFQKPNPLMVRQLGWSELRQAVIFCVLFIAAFALAK